MSNTGYTAAVTRDAILNLLTDAETAKVSNLEDGKGLKEGDVYIDLDDLAKGVQKGASENLIGHALPRSAVSAETWTKIVAQLGR
jgi:hypothetical protein